MKKKTKHHWLFKKIVYHWLFQRIFYPSNREFKRKVRARSKGLCGLCGYILGLGSHQVHHIYPKRWYPKLRKKPGNGVCLCARCHGFVDNLNTLQGRPTPLMRKSVLLMFGVAK